MQKSTREFVRLRLRGCAPPSDLSVLLDAFSEDQSFAEDVDNPLWHVGAVLLWPGQTYPLLDHNYLNDRDRADPHIMANIAAMNDTADKLRFVLQADRGDLLGYWQSRDADPLSECVLFWLDTEGQYRVAEGSTLAQTLAYRALVDGYADRHEAVVRSFGKLGVAIPEASKGEIFSAMDRRQAQVPETPQDYRDAGYKSYCKTAGLE